MLYSDKYGQDIDKTVGDYISIVRFFSSFISRLIRLIRYGSILVVL